MFGDIHRKPFFFLNINIEVVYLGERENGGRALEEQMEEKLWSGCVVQKRMNKELKKNLSETKVKSLELILFSEEIS